MLNFRHPAINQVLQLSVYWGVVLVMNAYTQYHRLFPAPVLGCKANSPLTTGSVQLRLLGIHCILRNSIQWKQINGRNDWM